MCTATVIPTPHGYRLATNRDELRTRPPAERPRTRTLPSATPALYPRDTLAGGTWVGVNAHALAVTLLNRNLTPPPAAPPSPRSRGLLVLEALQHTSAPAAASHIAERDLDPYPPFRLLAVDPHAVRVVLWERHELRVTSLPLEPICFASSGLGDQLVEPRLPLFQQTVVEPGPTPETQDAYHAHSWPDRLHISVLMDRPDARTVSRTVIHADQHTAHLRYTDDQGPSDHTLSLTGTRSRERQQCR